MSNLRTVVAAAGLVAVGFWLAPRQPPAAAPSAGRAVPRMESAEHPGVDVGALRAEIRAAVHAELGGQRPALDPDGLGNPDVAVAAVAEPSDQQVAAADQGRGFVEEAVARGRLTEDDANALRPMLAAMNADDAMEVRLSIAQAINSDRLAIDGPKALP